MKEKIKTITKKVILFITNPRLLLCIGIAWMITNGWSYVLLAIGRVHDVAHGSLRLSLSEYNTDEEVEHILKVVPEVVGYLRNMSPVWRDLQNGKREYIL